MIKHNLYLSWAVIFLRCLFGSQLLKPREPPLSIFLSCLFGSHMALQYPLCFKVIFTIENLHGDVTRSIITTVSKSEKIIQKMKNNPLNWRIDSIKTVARANGIEWRQQGTSHAVFIKADGTTMVVPVHKPIKPIYIKKFLLFVGA